MSIVRDVHAAAVKPFLNARGKLGECTPDTLIAIKAATEAELSARGMDQDIGAIVMCDGDKAITRFYDKSLRGRELIREVTEWPVHDENEENEIGFGPHPDDV